MNHYKVVARERITTETSFLIQAEDEDVAMATFKNGKKVEVREIGNQWLSIAVSHPLTNAEIAAANKEESID